jgi:lipoate-protein ligase A
MKCLDLTLAAPSANLACDEALLDVCDESPDAEMLRFWEPRECFVVLGYANRAGLEVNLAVCREGKIGVYRRCSGGGTVLQGPGCLNYSLVLNIAGDRALGSIGSASRHILERHRRALSGALGRAVSVAGITDLSLDGRKFSGNAQRLKRRALLFHGVFLLGFDIALMERFLPMPSRQPDYRRNRTHGEFLTNLDAPASLIKGALREEWGAGELCRSAPSIPRELEAKYAGDEWNLKFWGREKGG